MNEEQEREQENKKAEGARAMVVISLGVVLTATSLLISLGVILTLTIGVGLTVVGGDRVFPECSQVPEKVQCPVCPERPTCDRDITRDTLAEACEIIGDSISELYGRERVDAADFMMSRCWLLRWDVDKAIADD